MKPVMSALGAGVAILALASTAQASTIVDGSLDDWGVSPWDGRISRDGGDWTPDENVDAWTSEDWVGRGGRVGPGTGGQDYDIEAIYADLQGTELFLGLVTGFDQGGEGGWEAGAMFIDVSNDGTWDVAIEMHTDGTSTAGNMYTGGPGQWWTNPGLHSLDAPFQVDHAEATFTGTADFAYQNNAWGGSRGRHDHNVYEIGFDASAWYNDMMNDGYSIFWTMGCGNDTGSLFVDPVIVPEPATLSLLGLGLAGMAARSRRRKGGKA